MFSKIIINLIFVLCSWQINAMETRFRDLFNHGERGYLERIVKFMLVAPSELLSRVQKEIHSNDWYPSKIHEPSEPSEGLFLMVHGRNAHSTQFWEYLNAIRSAESRFLHWSLYAPEVRERGNLSLDELVEPILSAVHEWALKNPRKTIVAVCTSMGSRIFQDLSNKLTLPKDQNPILFFSLAGALGGSLTLTLAENWGIAKLWPLSVPEALRRELVVNSQRTEELMKATQERAKQGDIYYVYIGVADDILLLDPSLAFPNFVSDNSENVRYIPLTGVGHDGIVGAAHGLVFDIIEEWLNSKNIFKTPADLHVGYPIFSLIKNTSAASIAWSSELWHNYCRVLQ